MNKRQKITIAAMVAVAALFAGGVLGWERIAPAAKADAEASEHHDEHPAGGAAGGTQPIPFTDAQVAAADIKVRTAGAARLETFVRLPGEVKLNEDRTAHVTPRVDGIVQEVLANLGQQVRKGELLAVVASADVSEQRSSLAAAEKRAALARSVYESEKKLWEDKVSARQDYLKAEQEWHEASIAVQNARQKLVAIGASGSGKGPFNRLEIRAPFDGLIVDKHIAVGEAIGAETKIFTVSDLRQVWAEVVVPAKDLEIVKVGTDAVLHSAASGAAVNGKVSFVSAMIGEQTRAARARVVLENPQLAWRPGLFVDVDVVTGSAEVAVAVEKEALQVLNGTQVVFQRDGQAFTPVPVTVGRSDGKLVELTSGLRKDSRYAAAHSFTVKAEQGKGTAEHED
ncbi:MULTISPECIES: efflux RND transporter periplasmic adaptor subunit [unclassified Duganella]|uniref:efflux RND transporter periplasmic adaptor subunit n=1 Tax=unclassified Duganella TaxID=2636909 RepID=UPI0006F5A8AE|nr:MULTISPECIES: efflux RND transporter periplasmic adaptor subunit [unclassified Duganella]KQV58084.1 cytochrome C peroxidase [Duganella sp. Root336D2]KRB99067.1 cytochrome C peroxidase [Duganella sp. Root198D2]